MTTGEPEGGAYKDIVEIVAENPGSGLDDVSEYATDRGIDGEHARELLSDALDARDVIEADGKHWVVRKEKYAFDEYDHTEP